MASKKTGGSSSVSTVRITTGTVLKIIGLILGIIFLYFVQEIVVVLLLALLLAALIDPLADWFQKFKLGRGLAVVLVYLLIISFLSVLFILVAPSLRQQTQTMFSQYGPYLVEVVGDNQLFISVFSGEIFNLEFNDLLRQVQEAGLADSLPAILDLGTAAFGTILLAILVLVLAFYLVVEENNLRKSLALVTPEKYKPFAEHILPKAKMKIGQWLRGQLLVMFSIFVVTYILLEFVLNVPFALVLAILAGLLEVIPFIGPILASIPAIIIALSISPVHAFLTFLAYLGVQQLEGQVLTPKIMEKVTGINPVFSILAVLVGFELVGPVGAILAIPVAVVVGITYLEWLAFKKKSQA